MPYFISDATDCPAWAVVKADGEVIACHQSKQGAVDQMVALSLAEDIEPGGELRITGDVPAYIREAAAQGLAHNRAGHGGDGLTDQTIREARLMADGQVSDDKIIRASAWAARHAVDLEASKNNDAGDPEFPGAGAVAHYLWGINPLDPAPARAWFDRQAATIKGDRAMIRIAGGDPVIICDIDGTLLNGDTPIQSTIDYLAQSEEDVYIVTGRNESDRAATVRALAAAGVTYEELLMNPGATSDTLNFKRKTAQMLLEQHDVILAIDNNASMRRMYRALGIKAVNVGDLPPITRKATTVVETRSNFVQGMEVRAVGDKVTFKGYAAVFNSDSEPLPFIEQIKPGAFSRSLRSRNNIRMYVNHNDSALLASTRSKTLTLVEDSVGLLAEAVLPPTTAGRDMSILLEQRIVDSMSFGFSVPRGGDAWSPDGGRRTLNEVRLHEVSVVTGQPAYAATSATVRKLANRTATDEQELAAALSQLESGEALDAAQADLIRGIVDMLCPKSEPVVDSGGSLDVARQLLALMQMQSAE